MRLCSNAITATTDLRENSSNSRCPQAGIDAGLSDRGMPRIVSKLMYEPRELLE